MLPQKMLKLRGSEMLFYVISQTHYLKKITFKKDQNAKIITNRDYKDFFQFLQELKPPNQAS